MLFKLGNIINLVDNLYKYIFMLKKINIENKIHFYLKYKYILYMIMSDYENKNHSKKLRRLIFKIFKIAL